MFSGGSREGGAYSTVTILLQSPSLNCYRYGSTVAVLRHPFVRDIYEILNRILAFQATILVLIIGMQFAMKLIFNLKYESINHKQLLAAS